MRNAQSMVIALSVVLLVAPAFAAKKSKKTDVSFEVGQRWDYKAPPDATGSTLLIVKNDPEQDGGAVFVDIDGLRDPDGNEASLTFLPIRRSRLKRSVTELLEASLPATYLQSRYDEWRRHPIVLDLPLESVVLNLDSWAPAARGGGVVPAATKKPEWDDSPELIAAERAQYDKAEQLADEGRIGEALQLLDELAATCKSTWCRTFKANVEGTKQIYRYKGERRRFNQAVELANSGQRLEAIEILQELQEDVTDPELVPKVDEALKLLGA